MHSTASLAKVLSDWNAISPALAQGYSGTRIAPAFDYEIEETREAKNLLQLIRVPDLISRV